MARRLRRNPSDGQSPNSYGDFPSFDGSDVRGDRFSAMRYNFSNGWFVGREGGGIGLGMNGINRDGAFGNIPSLDYEGLQFGYTFQNAGMPLKIYAGFDTLKYNVGSGGRLADLDAMSGTLPGYGAHAGVEFSAHAQSQPVSRRRLHRSRAHRQRHQFGPVARRFAVCLRSPLAQAVAFRSLGACFSSLSAAA